MQCSDPMAATRLQLWLSSHPTANIVPCSWNDRAAARARLSPPASGVHTHWRRDANALSFAANGDRCRWAKLRFLIPLNGGVPSNLIHDRNQHF